LAQSNTRNLSWLALDLRAVGRLPTLGTVFALLVLAYMVGQGDWRGAFQLGMAGLVLFSMLAAPHYLGLFTMLAFLGAGAPPVSQVGSLGQFRWAVLAILALGLFFRNSMGVSGSRWHPAQFSLGIFVCCTLFSTLYSVNSLMTLLKAAAFGSLLLGALLYGRVESEGGPQSPCAILDHLFWCAGLAGVGCVAAAVHLLPGGPMHFRGPFGNPNALGAFIPLVAPVLLLRLSQTTKKEPIIRTAYVALAVLYAVCLLMSRSRTGIIATFVCCAWWLFFSSRKVFTWFVTTGFIGALILFAYFPGYVDSLNRTFVQKDSPYLLHSRERLLADSWEAAKANPVLGTGFGVAKGSSEEWQFGFSSGIAGREKMNSFLALVEEVGLVGAAFLVYPIIWVLAASARRLKLIRMFHASDREYQTVVTLSACLLGGLVDSMGEAWLTAAGFFACVMFWLIYGVLSTRLTMPLRPRQ